MRDVDPQGPAGPPDAVRTQTEFYIPVGSPVPAGPYSHSAARGPLVFTAGQVGRTSSGDLAADDITAQTDQAIRNLRLALRAAQTDLPDVISVQVYLAEDKDFAAMNEVYQEYFRPPYPARTTVRVGLRRGILVEISAVAWRGATGI